MKKAGVLMPVFSFPGKYGIGTLGKEAYSFIDVLRDTGNKIWQVLPMGPTGFGDSPYQSFSAFAGNPYFVDLEALIEEGLLTEKDLEDPEEFDFGDGEAVALLKTLWQKKAWEGDEKARNLLSTLNQDDDKYEEEDSPFKVNYGKIYVSKFKALKLAFDNYKKQGGKIDKIYKELRPETVEYCVFMAIKNSYFGASWDVWPEELRDYEKAAVEEFKAGHKDEIDFYAFVQYLFNKQWDKLHEYAKQKGIEIIGDIPIYCAPDSADVWAHRELFQYTVEGEPRKVAGVPPDAFSATGQLWGNPLYSWDVHKKTGYEWWLSRMDYCLEMYDTLRVDHFRGFEAYYAIPYGDETAENGEWVPGPGMDLFDAMTKHYGKRDLPIIAEDLGIITDEVKELMKKTGFPGMKILQFAWDSGPDNAYLPHSLTTPNCIYYTGTHDNDTLKNWFETLPDWIRNYMYMYMSRSHNDWNAMPELLIRLSMSTVADTVIVPAADYLGLGAEGRINTPGTSGGNWQWRMSKGAFTDEIKRKMSEIVGVYGRYYHKEEAAPVEETTPEDESLLEEESF